jgi:hypothetical protein
MNFWDNLMFGSQNNSYRETRNNDNAMGNDPPGDPDGGRGRNRRTRRRTRRRNTRRQTRGCNR